MNILVDGQTLESPERNRGIGVYCKNVLNNMVKAGYEHSWYITVSDETALEGLDPWVAKQLVPVVDGVFRPGLEYARTGAYTAALAKAVKEYEIDVYWNANPLMVNVLFPNGEIGCRMVLTVCDLIPAIMPVKEWGETVREEYARRLAFMGNTPGVKLLCISQSAKDDVEKVIGAGVDAQVTLLAANRHLFYTPRTKGGVGAQPYMVFTGGFDYRKNMEGAIEAFRRALEKYPGAEHLRKAKLYLVCNCPAWQRYKFYERLQKAGLLGRVELTGFIPDEELAALYAGADVFFFPSLYEGFGLPILEAMLGGAFVVSADNSSLPEVCGPHGLLCRTGDIEDMADKLQQGFARAAAESAEDKQARQAYALGFSWQRTAAQTLASFAPAKTAAGPSGSGAAGGKRLKIALATPWPGQKTGIANYVYMLMPYFVPHFDVDVFVDGTGDDAPLAENPWGGLYSLDELAARRGDYDEVLYQFGNSAAHHTGIYESAKQMRGIGEVHDFILHHFFLHTYFLRGEHGKYREALELAYGEEGLAHYKEVEARGGAPDDITYPMSDIVGKICRAAIVHNQYSRRTLRSKENVYVIPLACFPKVEMDEGRQEMLEAGLREKYGLRNDAFLVGVMGFINKPKRPGQLLQAVHRLKEKGYDMQVLFLGRCDDDEVPGLIEQYGLQKDVAVTGYLEKSEYEAGLAMCDMVANLRYPSMGESSATLCEAFSYAKPVLVSEVNQYTEFPDEVCWKVPVDESEVPVLVHMIQRLADEPKVREALGANALAYANSVLAPERIAGLYAQALQKIVEK